MIFVIPMAGDSRRFREAGYDRPKFQLEAHGASLFDHAVSSFSAYFQAARFLFVLRGEDMAGFVDSRCQRLGIQDRTIVALDRATAGQAETVLLGLERMGATDGDRIAIFNIDTFRPGYRTPLVTNDPDCAGYLEVFQGSGLGWSFVAPDPEHVGRAIAVAEKSPISSLCCTGLYYFRRSGDFRWAYDHPSAPRSEAEQRERYVAPLYNALIARGLRIDFDMIPSDAVIFCGTPEEYHLVLAGDEIARRLRNPAP